MPPSLQRILVLSILPILLGGYLKAQVSVPADPQHDSLARYVQTKYGLDQELFNGLQYYKRFAMYRGDPFLPQDSFYEGSVSIKGVKYDQLRLKYNGFSQCLILEYKDMGGAYNLLRLNKTHIDSFQMDANRFQKLSLFGEDPLFYQVLSAGQLGCYIHWKKNIQSTNNSLQYSHSYTRALSILYIVYKGEIQSFSNRKSLISIFPKPLHSGIRKFFKHQGFSFRKAGPTEIQNLLIHINQLIEAQT